MILLTNTTAQTLTPGQSIVFNEVITQSGCCECHRKNSPSVKLRANGIYQVEFHGNITGDTPATPLTLSIALGGEALPETTMVYTPATAAAIGNVGAATAIKNCCGDYDTITVVNNGTEDITLSANSSLLIFRRS